MAVSGIPWRAAAGAGGQNFLPLGYYATKCNLGHKHEQSQIGSTTTFHFPFAAAWPYFFSRSS